MINILPEFELPQEYLFLLTSCTFKNVIRFQCLLIFIPGDLNDLNIADKMNK